MIYKDMTEKECADLLSRSLQNNSYVRTDNCNIESSFVDKCFKFDFECHYVYAKMTINVSGVFLERVGTDEAKKNVTVKVTGGDIPRGVAFSCTIDNSNKNNEELFKLIEDKLTGIMTAQGNFSDYFNGIATLV